MFHQYNVQLRSLPCNTPFHTFTSIKHPNLFCWGSSASFVHISRWTIRAIILDPMKQVSGQFEFNMRVLHPSEECSSMRDESIQRIQWVTMKIARTRVFLVRLLLGIYKRPESGSDFLQMRISCRTHNTQGTLQTRLMHESVVVQSMSIVYCFSHILMQISSWVYILLKINNTKMLSWKEMTTLVTRLHIIFPHCQPRLNYQYSVFRGRRFVHALVSVPLLAPARHGAL